MLDQLRRTCLVSITVLLCACRGTVMTPSETSSFRFTRLPVNASVVGGTYQGYSVSGQIWPYVALNGAGGFGSDAGVYAPADGTVTVVEDSPPPGPRWAVTFSTPGGVNYYLKWSGSESVTPGQTVVAGQQIGTREVVFHAGASEVFLGLVNPTRTIGFAAPQRYADELLHCDSPARYFDASLRGSVTAELLHVSTDCGLNYDLPGTLQGHWFLSSAPPTLITSASSALKQSGWLWFVYSEMRDPVSPPAFVYFTDSYGAPALSKLGATDPSPRDITAAAGAVKFHLDPNGMGFPTQLLLVQLLDDRSVRAETFSGNPTDPIFTDRAQVYVR